MSVENFSQFNTKSLPLTGDYLVGYDSTAEIKTRVIDLIQAILPSLSIVPTGTIITHAAQTPPSGYLACDGRQLSRVYYANLFNVIGTTYGSSPGYFNIPDLRGYFVRGWDNGANVDIIDGTYVQSARNVTITTNTPHGLTTGNTVTVQFTTGLGVNGTFTITVVDPFTFSYTAIASQTASGNVILPGLGHIFGQKENDGVGSHNHTVNDPGHTHDYNDSTVSNQVRFGFGSADYANRDPQDNARVSGNSTTGITINSTATANETRPKNIALLYCIKY